MKNKREFPNGLYCITAEELSAGRKNSEVVSAMLSCGVRVIQYREKEKCGLDKYREALALRDMAARKNAIFIVNDDIDIACAIEADGVHIGQSDMPPEAVRKLVGEKMIIGLSTHSPEHLTIAMRHDIDYIGAGPVFATSTKKDVCAPVGFDYIDHVVKFSSLPFVAIGGIKENNVASVCERGAKSIAIVSDITGAKDICAKIEAIMSIMSKYEN